MLDAALRPAARVTNRGRARVDAVAAAAVLGLVALTVDGALEHHEDDAEEHREERDAYVGLQVPLLNTSHSQEEDDHRVLFGFLHCSKGINNLTSSGDSTEQEATGEGGGPGSRGSCGGGRWPV